MTSGDKNNIQLIIRKRERVLFEGEVKAFTSYNERGVFDILSTHTNFISLINKQYVIHKNDGTTSEMKIDEGIISVYNNKVIVYLGLSV